MTNNIRHLRKEKGWTVRDLADEISKTHSVHFTTIAKLERSEQKLSPEWIERFSCAFGVSPHEIVKDSQPVLARRLPIISLDDAWKWEEEAANAEDYINAPGRDRAAFAVFVKQDQFESFPQLTAFAFVEAGFPGMLPDHKYLVHGPDRASFIAVFRSEPARMEPLNSKAGRPTFMLGIDEMKILGHVMGMFVEL